MDCARLLSSRVFWAEAGAAAEDAQFVVAGRQLGVENIPDLTLQL